MAWADCGDVTKREKIYGPFNIVFECNFHHFHIKNTHFGSKTVYSKTRCSFIQKLDVEKKHWWRGKIGSYT